MTVMIMITIPIVTVVVVVIIYCYLLVYSQLRTFLVVISPPRYVRSDKSILEVRCVDMKMC